MLVTIKEFLKSPIPPAALAQSIAPLLNQVNNWSSQAEQICDEGAANLVFDYRNTIFKGWADTSACGIPSAELPPPFAEFKNLVKNVMDYQAFHKKSATKVLVGCL
jgi:hypothetical protein